MKHIFRIFFSLTIIIILYMFLKKNKLIEGHRVKDEDEDSFNHNQGFLHRGLRSILLLTGEALAGYDDYDTLFYQPTSLCFDTLGNIIACSV